jgi:pimeloyl-ACP methyl ester carboxylesterase
MLDVWTWEVGRPSVLLVHDWGGCGEQLSAFIRPILDAGFGVVAFDGPAHGRSKAVETDLRTFSRFIRQVVTQFPTIRTAIGHSFGGSSLTLAVGRGLPLARVAMIAPFARSERNVARLSRVLALPAELEARTSASLRASLEEDAEAWDLASFSTDLDTPVLIVHDEDDREVDVSEGREIAARWPGARLMITRGLGHRRVVSAPEVTERVVKFLAGTQPD